MSHFRSALLSFSSWNVKGLFKNFFLGDKLSSDDFLISFKHCDVIVLTETWRTDNFCIPGFELLTIPSTKHNKKKNGRSSGGIALGFKTALKQGITLIASNSNVIWSKFDKMFFNLDHDLFFCAIYIPPRDSPYFNPDIFQELQNDIAKYSLLGFVIVAGDLNARTGCPLNFVDVDLCTHIPGDNLPLLPTPRRINNFDSQINEHGKSLLEICKACDMRILNGRTTGDSFGKITFHSPKGISTVDYFIVSHELMNSIENFMVKDPTIFSDHSQLTCWVTISPKTSPQNISHPRVNMSSLPKRFVWNQNACEVFLDVLRQEEFVSRISSFENTSFPEDSEGVNLATEQFTDIINDACLRSLT